MEAGQQPIDLEAERTFLGGLMLATELNEDHLRSVQPEDFYDRRHRLIFESICQESEGGGADAPSLVVIDRLRRQGALQTAGGAEYIEQIVAAQMIPKASIQRSGQIISEQAQLRQLIQAAQDIIQAAQEKEVEVGDKLDAAEQRIMKIRDRRDSGQGMIDMVDVMKDITSKMTEGTFGTKRGLVTGFERLDRYLGGLQPGHFVVLGARPGMGKTSLALTMAANVARLNDCAVGVFSLEMPAQELVERLLASTAKVNMLDLKRNMPTFETDPDRFFKVMERMGDAVAAMDNTIIHVDDQPGLTLADVRHRTRNLERQVKKIDGQKKLGVIVIDYLQLMRASAGGSKNRSREQEVAEISKGLKGLAKELGITVIALSQLRRQVEQEGAVGEDGKSKGDREPRLSDLRESGAIEQDADSVLVLHKPSKADEDDDESIDDASTVKLLVLKNRHGDRGAVMLDFRAQYTLFTPQAVRRDNAEMVH
ncbi:MAG: replicative DNA helicase [Myxococcota bacterium]|nr:replicative DNA helicase [Myxococcota bacterium]